MNSEFKPPKTEKDINGFDDPRDEVLRIKLLKSVRKCPECYSRLPKKANFKTFFESVNRKFVRLTEPDAKRIFELLDPMKTGFVDGGNILRQAELGSKYGILNSSESRKNSMSINNLNSNSSNSSANTDSDRDSSNDSNGNTHNNSNHNNNSKKNGNSNNDINNQTYNNTNTNKNNDNINNNNNTNNTSNNNNNNDNNNNYDTSDENLKIAINNICGRNLHLLEYCFASSDNNKKYKQIDYENFIKLLKEGGLCKDIKICSNLFYALGGSSGKANIEKVRNNCYYIFLTLSNFS